MGLHFINDLPKASELDLNYDLLIDALFGFSFKAPVRPTFETVMSTLSEVTIPVAAIDVPSVSAVTKQLPFA